MSSPWMSAEEAAAALGVQRATLYAYVSRGLLRSEPGEQSNRSRRYRREDVAHLQERQTLRTEPERAVVDALDFGTPVLDSSLSLIEDGRLYYRGHDVMGLARNASVEEVAALLWTGDTDGVTSLFRNVSLALPPGAEAVLALPGLRLVERFAVLLPLLGSGDAAAWDLRPLALAHAGARVLSALVAATGAPSGGGLVQRLARAWAPARPEAEPLLRAALILAADHELNVSAFTARCVASAGGTAYHVVSAGLAALQGVRHGGHTERVEALLAEVALQGDAAGVIEARLRRGEGLPGFGQRLYPQGDPRGRLLLQLLEELDPSQPELARARAVAEAVLRAIGEHPTIDFGLATLGRSLGLPSGAALGLFALGRSIGWVGHAIEQAGSDRIIRPRARYVGPRPL